LSLWVAIEVETSSLRGATMESNRADQPVAGPDTPGLFTRPPLLFLAALLTGFVLDWLLGLPFPVPGTDPVHRIGGGLLILTGLAPPPQGSAISQGPARRIARSSPRPRW